MSSSDNDFNTDFHVSFPDGSRYDGIFYNFEQRPDPGTDELSGRSVFFKDENGIVYHTYSNFGRGGEPFLGVYAFLDLVPKGRDETKNGTLTDWVKRHDQYPETDRSRGAIV